MLAFAAVPLVSRRYRLAFDLRIAWVLLWLSFLVAGRPNRLTRRVFRKKMQENDRSMVPPMCALRLGSACDSLSGCQSDETPGQKCVSFSDSSSVLSKVLGSKL